MLTLQPIGGGGRTVENARQEAADIRRAGLQQERGRKRSAADAGLDPDEDAHDEVRLWEDGFKERYYESKFEVARENMEFRLVLASGGRTAERWLG